MHHRLTRYGLAAAALPAALGLGQARAQTAAPAALDEVRVVGERVTDVQERRESAATKIVIGRDEIERQGDATLGDVLKRLPGVTLGGAPGRGSGVRMRGLGQGYTQLLIDGQRVPPGFSIESLTPEMVERIEILRAPTAETGARAIAGTINIVTREGRRGMPLELKASATSEAGLPSASASVAGSTTLGKAGATYTLSLDRTRRPEHAESRLVRTDAQGTTERLRITDGETERTGVRASARLQWSGAPGETFLLMPFVVHSRSDTAGTATLAQAVQPALGSPSAGSDAAAQAGDSRFTMARLNGDWKRRLSADSRMEWKLGAGGFESRGGFSQVPATSAGLLPGLAEATETRDRSANLAGKLLHALNGDHQWVSGVELETVRRTQSTLASYAPGSADLSASSRRWALYSQDEWQLTRSWAAHVGARYESLLTEGTVDAREVANRNAVFTPLLHAMWRPDPASRNQLRVSLTRSFRTPEMQALLARRTFTRDSNSPTNPDTAGNPALQPEVATGLDVAAERYLADGGVLSASAFHRRIDNHIRRLVSLGSDGRWVSSPQNVGDAVTTGVELEAKFRLNSLLAAAPAVDLRSNVGLFRSRVLSVPGPDNRLDQQPSVTANLGADYRLRAVPLTVGGNLNWNPGYTTRSSEVQSLGVSARRVADVYALWRVSPATAWRLTAGNVAANPYATSSLYDDGSTAERSLTRTRSWTTVQLRLEVRI